jgi:leader peptidase (prepilin peptidase)/N-methyltransferase
MLRILGTIFAALLGLCFGSFLNVCLSRWPAGESVVHPRSHCRACRHTLAWWENMPLVSWIGLRGKCRGCGSWIGVRYLVVEAAVAVLWAYTVWSNHEVLADFVSTSSFSWLYAFELLSVMALFWLLTALAVLDAEHLWLPDRLTLSSAALGFVMYLVAKKLVSDRVLGFAGWSRVQWGDLWQATLNHILEVLIATAIILLIRWVYWLIRRREGMGLGDAKLMAMLAAWLGLPGALLSLFLGVVLGAVYAVSLLAARPRRREGPWATAQLPLGTFLCIGGIVSALWGERIIAAYLRLFL